MTPLSSQLREIRRGVSGLFAPVVVVVMLVLATPPQSVGQTVSYSVLDLSEADAGHVPSGLNNLGDVVGRAGDPLIGDTRATIWNRGRLQKKHLGALPGGEYSSASSINDIGEIAGASNTATSIVPFVWTPKGRMQRIAMLWSDSCGQAFSINKFGHVVGYSAGPRGTKAFLWTRTEGVRGLGTLPGGSYSTARDLNDSDEVAGTSGSAAGDRAVVWTTSGNVRDLGTLPGDKSSEATAINNRGDVVGYSKGPRGMRAFVWTRATGMQDLGVLPGGDSSRAFDINDAGCVVGTSTSSLGDRAFKWTPEAQVEDLNDAVSTDIQVILVEAHAINGKGQIVVMGTGGPVSATTGGTAVDIAHTTHGSAVHQCAPAPESTFLLTPAAHK